MKGTRRIRARSRSAHRVRSLMRQLESTYKTVAPAPGEPAGRPDAATLRHYHDLYDVAPVGFFTLDRQGRICEVNEKGARLLGFASEWLRRRTFAVFVARQDVQRFIDLLLESTRTMQPAVADLDLCVGARTIPAQVSLVTSRGDGGISHHLTVVDLSDLRNTEKLLQESLSNWYSLVHNAPDTILTVETRGRISFINKPMWGYSISALMGTNICDHVPETERPKLLQCLEQAFRYNKRSMCEITGINGDRKRWFNFCFGTPHGIVSYGIGSTTTTTTLMIQEISDQKQTEASLRESGRQLRDFAARVEAVREEERTRVAREIHDELGQSLTVLKLDAAWIMKKKTGGTGEVRERMKEMISQIDDTIERVRRISSELRPSILDDLGLLAALEWQVDQFRKRTKIRTELVSNVDGLNLPLETSAALFRVVQEGLTNVMRHARATKVRITLEVKQNDLRISIVDNGVGIKRGTETDLRSIGIVGMRERITRLDGTFNILSERGKGTRLDIVIPKSPPPEI